MSHLVSDGLLAVFFFIVAVELSRELVIGELNSLSKAPLPAIAAIGGVVVPALVYLSFTARNRRRRRLADPDGDRHRLRARGAGDLRVGPADPGAGLPDGTRRARRPRRDPHHRLLLHQRRRTSRPSGSAAIAITVFGAMSRLLRPRSPWVLSRRPQWPIITAMVVLAALAWYFTYQSGVHATIAGVALGFVISRRPGGRAVHAIEPWSNGIILPLFAFSAALVVDPGGRSRASSARRSGASSSRCPSASSSASPSAASSAAGSSAGRVRRRSKLADLDPRRRPRRHRLHGVAAHERAGVPRQPRGRRSRAVSRRAARLGVSRSPVSAVGRSACALGTTGACGVSRLQSPQPAPGRSPSAAA